MWDRPRVLSAGANALFAVAALLVLYGAWSFAARLPVFALQEVTVSSKLTHVTGEQIEGIVRRELKGTFLTVDLAATRAAFRKLPWVRQVDVRRQWPARLDIAIEEHLPLARWGSTALVNTHGEVFSADYSGDLPLFIGPEGASREMTIQYRYFARTLEALGDAPVQVRVSPRRAWQVKLGSGLTLELGRENVEARLARFVATHGRTLARLGRRVEHVDLRYANGFAVRVPDLAQEKPQTKRGKGAGA